MEQKRESPKNKFATDFGIICENVIKRKLNKEIAYSLFAYCNASGIPGKHLSDICQVIVEKYDEYNKSLTPKVPETSDKIKDFLKEEIRNYLGEHPEIKVPPDPEKRETDTSLAQRRMDSLARILCVTEEKNPCIAVALVGDELVVSYNKPIEEENQLKDLIREKVLILRDFLRKVNSLDGITSGTGKIEASPSVKLPFEAKKYADEALIQLKKAGGIPNVLPENKSKRKRDTVDAHMVRALLKVAGSVINGSLSNDKFFGFNNKQIYTLLNKEINFVPEKIKIDTANLHAEQAIASYLLANKPTEEVNIGISKLCCQACAKVLSDYKREIKIAYRGTHDVRFPNVYDLTAEKIYEGRPTKMFTDMNPEDSESEPEIEKDIKANLKGEEDGERPIYESKPKTREKLKGKEGGKQSIYESEPKTREKLKGKEGGKQSIYESEPKTRENLKGEEGGKQSTYESKPKTRENFKSEQRIIWKDVPIAEELSREENLKSEQGKLLKNVPIDQKSSIDAQKNIKQGLHDEKIRVEERKDDIFIKGQ